MLDGNDIRGTGLTHLSHQPELIDLSLSHPNLTNLSAENLAELKPLKRLSLAGSGLTNAGIKHLANLTNLESLDLRHTKATAAGIDELKAGVTEVQDRLGRNAGQMTALGADRAAAVSFLPRIASSTACRRSRTSK